MKKLLIVLLVILLVAQMVYAHIPTINPDDYPVAIDYGTLSEDEQQLFTDILTAVAEGRDTVACPPVSDSLRGKLLTHIGMYYGNMEGVFRLIRREDGYLALDLDLFREYEAQKVIIDARVDEAIASLHEGPDIFKLWQICTFIADRIEYTDGVRETIEGLNGRGVCATYAMLFYKMAWRLGIQTYICYGFAAGGYHSWNMTELHGRMLFFDVTWFDSLLPVYLYVAHPTSWGRDYVINNIIDGAALSD